MRTEPYKRNKPHVEEDMKLPEGKTCGNCVHFKRCNQIFGHIAADEVCDWAPSRFKAKSLQRSRYLYAWRRRFGFQYGQSFVTVKEYRSRTNMTPDLSFVVPRTTEETPEEIEKLVRTEIHKRINHQ